MNISLNGKWKLYYYNSVEKMADTPSALADVDFVECNVPGNVELDLSKAGILPEDMFKGENILLGEEYETYEWWYETVFDGVDINPGDRAVLKFEGVDTIAQYFLNGNLIGESDNMFIAHEFDITNLMEDKNTLHIRIKPAVLEELDMESNVYTMGNWQRKYDYRCRVRKAPHCYGWDIMPRAVSAGLWRDVSISVVPECGFRQVYIVTDHFEDKNAVLQFMYDIRLPRRFYRRNLTVRVKGICGENEFYAEKDITYKSGYIEILAENPKLWWPYGYGDANLYEVSAELLLDGEVIADEKFNFGIRTVKLLKKDIIEGDENCFRFVINGEDVVCKGSNWVPLDAYHSRDAMRYEKAMELVSDIGCNILRCWGGNVYEDTYFYDYCDRNGIMIWQDFSMACVLYPQTPEFHSKIAKEAESVIKKLRQHPSIILWSGDNECDMISMRETSANPNQANKITRQILPDVITAHDKCRPYLQSSPYISDIIFKTRRFDLIPENHLWGLRDYYKSNFYKNAKAHFVSETGYHGAPNADSVRRFIDDEYHWPPENNKQWILHSSDQVGNPSRVNLMTDQIRQLFGEVPDNLDEFCEASQFSQAEAKKYFIERVRINTPRTGGIIWWNILDGWPQLSDAVVDYYFEKKLAYHYIKRAQAPFTMICGETYDAHIPLYAVNDTLEPKSGTFAVECGNTGEIVLEGEYTIDANCFKKIGEIKADYSEKRMLMIKWNGGCNHYISGSVPFDLKQYRKWNKIIMENYNNVK